MFAQYADIVVLKSMHWHLDVTFKEDANHTLDKTAAQNHNIIRKWVFEYSKTVGIDEQ